MAPARRQFVVVCSCVLFIMSGSLPDVTWATLEEGAILWSWASKIMGNPSSLTTWAKGSDPCGPSGRYQSNPWSYVLCSSTGFVCEIFLQGHGLSGPIAAELGQLSRLEILRLEYNNFHGSIPPELGNLSSLLYLDLSSNKLTGEIPTSFGNLLDVTYINLNHNNLSGGIHPRLGDLLALSYLDLSYNKLIEGIPKSFGNLLNANYMILDHNNLTGSIPSELGSLSSLSYLDLSTNKLTGEIPTSFGNLLTVTYISLSFNKLSGSIPIELTKPRNLLNFQVAYNNLSGRVYANASWSQQRLTAFVGNNPNLCGAPVRKPCLGDLSPMKNLSSGHVLSNKKLTIVMVVSMLFGVAVVTIVFSITVRRLRKKIMALRAIEEEFAKKEVKPNLYSYNELKSATQNFSSHNLLGQGGFGTVYKGILSNGTKVAVKHLNKSKQVLYEFLNEIVLITGIRHCNLVKLKGCCLCEDQRILVYEYIDNGDLSDALWKYNAEDNAFGRGKGLNWATRLKIILEVAQGLTYLHEHVQPPIIHRDIKAPNILLDREFRAKIADFGLALLFPPLEDGRTHLTAAQISGTRGYMAPEYASFGQLTTKVDVFSFGVLVLEIVSGRKNIDMKTPGQEYLLEQAWKLHTLKRLHNLVDEQLTIDKSNLEEITRVTRVGLLCIQYVAARRPQMSDVVAMLQGRIPLPEISTNYEFDMYIDHEAGTDSSTCASEWNQPVECEEKPSMLYSHDDALRWQDTNKVAMKLTWRYNKTQSEPFDGYWT